MGCNTEGRTSVPQPEITGIKVSGNWLPNETLLAEVECDGCEGAMVDYTWHRDHMILSSSDYYQLGEDQDDILLIVRVHNSSYEDSRVFTLTKNKATYLYSEEFSLDHNNSWNDNYFSHKLERSGLPRHREGVSGLGTGSITEVPEVLKTITSTLPINSKLLSNGRSVVYLEKPFHAWGDPEAGGILPPITPTHEITSWHVPTQNGFYTLAGRSYSSAPSSTILLNWNEQLNTDYVNHLRRHYNISSVDMGNVVGNTYGYAQAIRPDIDNGPTVHTWGDFSIPYEEFEINNIVTGRASGTRVFASKTGFAATITYGDTANTSKLVSWGKLPTDSFVLEVQAKISSVYSHPRGSSYAAVISPTHGDHAPERAVVTWGDTLSGGDSSSVQGELAESHIHTIVSNGNAMVALNAERNVIAWGNPNKGGTIPAEITDILEGNVSKVETVGMDGFLVTLKNNNHMVYWTGDGRTGEIQLTWEEKLKYRCETLGAFVSITDKGRLLVIGASDQGGVIPDMIYADPRFKNPKDIYCMANSVAVRTSDNTLFYWSDANSYEIHEDAFRVASGENSIVWLDSHRRINEIGVHISDEQRKQANPTAWVTHSRPN